MGGYKDIQLLVKKGIEGLSGGFPCQDISIAGRGEGLAGKRSGLWREYLRTICLVRPEKAVVENVAALLHRGLGTVLGDLAERGYDAQWGGISARQVTGGLHLRERVFIVAYRDRMRESQPQGSKCNKRRRNYNEAEAVASDSLRIFHGSQEQDEARERQSRTSSDNPLPQKEPFTDNGGERIQRFIPQAIQRQPEFSWCENVRGIEDLSGRPDIPEPLIRREGDGIPTYMDRIKGLGNAIMPAKMRIIGKLIN